MGFKKIKPNNNDITSLLLDFGSSDSSGLTAYLLMIGKRDCFLRFHVHWFSVFDGNNDLPETDRTDLRNDFLFFLRKLRRFPRHTFHPLSAKNKNAGRHNASLHKKTVHIGARILHLYEASGVGRFLYKTQDILTYPQNCGFTVTHSRGFSPHSSPPFPAEPCISYSSLKNSTPM